MAIVDQIAAYFFEALSRRRQKVRFVQIGAHDGVDRDPICAFVRRHQWSGVLVEPVKEHFDRLRENYRDCPGLAFVNCAISSRSGEMPFFRLRHPEAAAAAAWPDWYDMVGTLSKEVFLKYRRSIPDVESHIVEERVRCLTFADVMEAERMEAIDLLVIDTEGHDAEIIGSIDLQRFTPGVIYYEAKHHDRAAQDALAGRLDEFGYLNVPLAENWMAVKMATLTARDLRYLGRVIGLLADSERRLAALWAAFGDGGTFKVTRKSGQLSFERQPDPR